MSCSELEFLGIEINPFWNKSNKTQISTGKTPVLVIPTNEELAIMQEVRTVLAKEEQFSEA
jgi:acetate kinase